MRIVVDALLPDAAARFGELGQVTPLAAADLTAAAVRDADALIVRSVTRVDEALLAGGRVRFVGSATSGTDHVDQGYLRRAGISFADAAGANSAAVGEYVVAALLELRARLGIRIAGARLGVVGCGHVGRCVARYAAALGMDVVVNDPPLARATCEPLYRPLEEVLACDVVSLHVPLERGGPDPTYRLVDERFLAAMIPGAVLINAARGAVVDSDALKRAIRSGRLGASVLDVWENEPAIDPELLAMVTLGTAHIAGNTLDAKRRAVEMVFAAAVRALGRNAPAGAVTNGDPRAVGNDSGSVQAQMGGGGTAGVVMPISVGNIGDPLEAIEACVRPCFDIAAADARLRDAMSAEPGDRARGFDALRSAASTRREFGVHRVTLDANHSAADTLRALGFAVGIRAEASGRLGGVS